MNVVAVRSIAMWRVVHGEDRVEHGRQLRSSQQIELAADRITVPSGSSWITTESRIGSCDGRIGAVVASHDRPAVA